MSAEEQLIINTWNTSRKHPDTSQLPVNVTWRTSHKHLEHLLKHPVTSRLPVDVTWRISHNKHLEHLNTLSPAGCLSTSLEEQVTLNTWNTSPKHPVTCSPERGSAGLAAALNSPPHLWASGAGPAAAQRILTTKWATLHAPSHRTVNTVAAFFLPFFLPLCYPGSDCWWPFFFILSVINCYYRLYRIWKDIF